MRSHLLIAFLPMILWSTAARSQDIWPDTLHQTTHRSSISLALGGNLWQENPGPPGGTGTLSILFGLWREVWGQVDLGAWTHHGFRPAFRFGVAVQYRVPLTAGVYAYPKTGIGIVFVPELLWSFGLGVACEMTRKFDLFLEVGEHIAHRESQLRANYYPLAIYVNVGLIIRSVR
jgi:hypothetical protein